MRARCLWPLLLCLFLGCASLQQVWDVGQRAAIPAAVGAGSAALGAPASIVGGAIFTVELFLEALAGNDLEQQITDEGVRVVTREVVKNRIPYWAYGIGLFFAALLLWSERARRKLVSVVKDIADGPDEGK